MSETDKKWLKTAALYAGGGIAVGFIAKALMKLLVPTWTLLINMIVPSAVVFALLVVLYKYNKEKDNMLH